LNPNVAGRDAARGGICAVSGTDDRTRNGQISSTRLINIEDPT